MKRYIKRFLQYLKYLTQKQLLGILYVIIGATAIGCSFYITPVILAMVEFILGCYFVYLGFKSK